MKTLESKARSDKSAEQDAVVAHNTRVGVILFMVYLVFYGGFMALSAFSPETMSEPFLGGVNVAVVYAVVSASPRTRLSDSVTVADVVPSYVLLTPCALTINARAVIFAEVEAVVLTV